eukprot:TRINITY_DN5056_c0_g1_i1.p1 TRINITY_DN5056_c0_g1~~TRINITY_DN5056_c0_g1_i1.p1  ORF type:complete len:162 (-),score=37.56 TRINITY_DN5056_c0_g1_i1:102-587(-)
MEEETTQNIALIQNNIGEAYRLFEASFAENTQRMKLLLHEKDREISSLRDTIMSQNKHIDSLKNSNEQRSDLIRAMKNQLKDTATIEQLLQQDHINDVATKIEDLYSSKIETLSEEIKDKDEQIDTLTAERESLYIRINQMKEMIDDFIKKMAVLQNRERE